MTKRQHGQAEQPSESGSQNQTPPRIKKVRFIDECADKQDMSANGPGKRPVVKRDKEFTKKAVKSLVGCIEDEAATKATEQGKSAYNSVEQQESEGAEQQSNAVSAPVELRTIKSCQ